MIMKQTDIVKALKEGLMGCRWLPQQNRFHGIIEEVATKLLRGEFYPAVGDVFASSSILDECPRLVVVATDPYPNERIATGIPFAVPDAYADKIPCSLAILKRILPVGNGFIGDWIKWARDERVLLLNRSLTRFKGDRYATFGVWDRFIEAILNEIIRLNPLAVFWLMGNKAKDCKLFLPNKVEDRVVCSCHPSYVHYVEGNPCQCYQCFEAQWRKVRHLMQFCSNEKSVAHQKKRKVVA